MAVTRPDRPSLGQTLAYVSPEFYGALTFTVVNSWLFYFHVNVLELTPALAGAAFVIGRVFDAVLDPMVGRWSDRVRPQRGRVVFLRWASVPMALAFVALFAAPALLDGKAARFVAATIAFMAYSFLYTLITIPRYAMIPDLAPSYDARTVVTGFISTTTFLAVLMAIAATPEIVLALGPSSELAATEAPAWTLLAAVFAGLGLVISLPFLVALREPAYPGGQVTPPMGTLRDQITSLRLTPGYALVLGIWLAVHLGITIVQALTPFLLESVLGIPGTAQGPVLLTIFATSLVSFPLWVLVGVRIGKRAAFIAGLLTYMVFLAALPMLPRDGVTVALLAMCLLGGAGVAAVTMFPWTMVPDVVDVDAATHGTPREALVTSTFVFVSKVAGSVAIALNAGVLVQVGHRAGQAVQDETTIAGIVAMTSVVPIAIFAVAVLLASRYRVDRAAQARARAAIVPGPRSAPSIPS